MSGRGLARSQWLKDRACGAGRARVTTFLERSLIAAGVVKHLEPGQHKRAEVSRSDLIGVQVGRILGCERGAELVHRSGDDRAPSRGATRPDTFARMRARRSVLVIALPPLQSSRGRSAQYPNGDAIADDGVVEGEQNQHGQCILAGMVPTGFRRALSEGVAVRPACSVQPGPTLMAPGVWSVAGM